MAAIRVTELQRLRRARYPDGIPNTADGRVLVRVIVHHLGQLAGDQRRRVTGWLTEHAPWLTLAEHQELLAELVSPRRWRADRLAWRLKLIEADRKALRITTIGSIDVDRATRAERRRDRNRQAKAQARAAAGAIPRAQYEAQSIAQAKPWEAEGISRRTWYRRRGTGPGTA